MDKPTDRETLDFMNVESFSQLPFIRPSPSKDKPIRLFGIEFGTPNSDSDSGDVVTCENAKDTAETSGESSRRFECHYCCRNFPTSQALGGHQNAHKRERQHAKRAHLQSSAAIASAGFADSHVYGLLNYHRLAGAAAPSPVAYPSWNRASGAVVNGSAPTRFYGSPAPYSPATAINGSPLAMWRISAVQNSPAFGRERSLVPVAAGDEMKGAGAGGSAGARQSRFVYETKTAEQVSLDLHL